MWNNVAHYDFLRQFSYKSGDNQLVYLKGWLLFYLCSGFVVFVTKCSKTQLVFIWLKLPKMWYYTPPYKIAIFVALVTLKNNIEISHVFSYRIATG